jgi:hypothetical protein
MGDVVSKYRMEWVQIYLKFAITLLTCNKIQARPVKVYRKETFWLCFFYDNGILLMDKKYNKFMDSLLNFTDECEVIKWIDFFKNDGRALLWLSTKAAASYYPCGSSVPDNFYAATALIERYDGYLKGSNLEVYKRDVLKIMADYLNDILPVSDFQWLEKADGQGLYWVWVYIHFNKPRETYIPQADCLKTRSFISTADEIFPLILQKLDNTISLNDYRKDYLSVLLKEYSSFVIKRNPVYWLDPKDKEGCSWVWQYIIDKYEHLDFLAPITSEDIYLAIVAVTSNWDLLHKKVEIEPQTAFNENTYDRYTSSAPYTPSAPYTSSAPYTPPYIPSVPYTSSAPYTPPYTSSAPYTPPYTSSVPYTPPYTPPYTSSAPYTPSALYAHPTTSSTQAFNNVHEPYRSNSSLPPVPDRQDGDEQKNETKCNTLITKDMLLKQLYNGHKQRKHRERNESTFNLTKANQKKLTNYAKDQNTTEKKALNEIVKTMLD